MNITEWAEQVLEMAEENRRLHIANECLTMELERYQGCLQTSVDTHNQMFADILVAACDPESNISVNMREKFASTSLENDEADMYRKNNRDAQSKHDYKATK